MSAQDSTSTEVQGLSDHALRNQIQKQILRAEIEGKFEDMRWEPQGELADDGGSE